MKKVKGYKAVNKVATNRYGKTLNEGETYKVDEEIKF